MSARGLFKPENYAADTGGGSQFKEGLVRVDQTEFKVHHFPEPKNPKPDYVHRADVIALSWLVTRLDEEQQPLLDAEDNPITEEINFSLGGKSLDKVHPGKAESPDDDEPEDQGIKAGTAGNTLYLVNTDFQIHPRSAAAHLFQSLIKAGFKADYIGREWAPDYKGLVAHMKTYTSDDPKDFMKQDDGKGGTKEVPVPYKIVDKIIRAGYEKKGKGNSDAADKASSNGKDTASEELLKPILEAISASLDGKDAVTKSALAKRVAAALTKQDVDSKLHIPLLGLVKDEGWLKKHAKAYDYTIDDDGMIQFGTP